jgi:signal transduction histidine kinase/CheY-like chemotaxis protein
MGSGKSVVFALALMFILYMIFIMLTPVKSSRAQEGEGYRPRVASPSADAVIGVSYLAIPIELSVFLYQLPATTFWQNVVIALFVCFIAFCGIGHFLDAAGADVSLVLLDRYLTAGVSAVTACLSPVVLHYLAQAVLQALREREVLTKQRDMLTDAQSMSHLGNWEVEFTEGVLEGHILASDEWFRIFGIVREQHDTEPLRPLESRSWFSKLRDILLRTGDRGKNGSTDEEESLTLAGFDLESAQTAHLTNDELHEYPPEGNRIPMERYLALIHEEDRDTIVRAMQETATAGRTYYIEQRARRERDNREIVIKGFGKAVYNKGKIVSLRGTAQDVTEDHERNRQLKEAKELALMEGRHKDIFLATMSHELRTPLTSILGHVELIEETPLEDLQREYVRNTRTAASTLLSLINDILDYSKLVAGMIDLERRSVDPRKILTEVQNIASSLCKDVSLSVGNYHGPWIEADGTRLRQVLINLVSNAIKFTPAGGTVQLIPTFNVSPDGICHIRLTVRDNGIGMSPQVISRLFTPFCQGDASVSRKYGGTGLGLSIVKRIVDAMGGALDVQSEEGKGSSFSFSFSAPVVESEEAAPEVVKGKPSSTSTSTSSSVLEPRPRRVLLAEDNPVTQSLVRRMLQPVGCILDVVDNGAEAVEAVLQSSVKTEPYDVFLCDFNMPVMDGLTATRRIRELPQGKKLRIVGLTANAFKSDRDACLEAGMDDYLSKPFKKAALLDAIAAV